MDLQASTVPAETTVDATLDQTKTNTQHLPPSESEVKPFLPPVPSAPLSTEELYALLHDYFWTLAHPHAQQGPPTKIKAARRELLNVVLADCLRFNPNHHMFVEAMLEAMRACPEPGARDCAAADAQYLRRRFRLWNNHVARQAVVTNTNFVIPLLVTYRAYATSDDNVGDGEHAG